MAGVSVNGGVGAARRLVRALLAVVMVPVVILAVPPTPAGAMDTFVVTTTGDGGDTDIGDGDCIATTGGCTLRAAIQEANDDGDHDIIEFALGGPGEIVTGSDLPLITESLTIDGSTNPGANCDFLGGVAQPPLPTVAIAGSTLIAQFDVDEVVFRNLSIHSGTSGVLFAGLDVAVLECSWVGFDLNGTPGTGQTGTGVRGGTRVGGSTGDPSNVIGAWGFTGVNSNGLVSSNRIGVRPDGSPAGNDGAGVVGGEDARVFFNLIAHSRIGVVPEYGTEVRSNTIRNNLADGIDATGVVLPPFGTPAILIFERNSIRANGRLGIDTLDDGPNGDATAFSGRATITSVVGSTLNVRLRVNSARVGTPHDLEIYFNDACDSSGFGEGQDYRETVTITPNAEESFHSVAMATSPPPVAPFVTATLSNSSFTSEFSNCRGESSQFVVNAQTNGGDTDPGDGDCLDAGGFCTLRAAIEEVNALGGAVDEIVFDLQSGASIPVSGSELPPIAVPVTIDGSTNAGAICGSAAGPPSNLVRLQGGAGISVGLDYTSAASGSTLRGVQVTGFGSDGVLIDADDMVLTCNVFGSATASGNLDDGLDVRGDGNIVGGSFQSDGNMMVNNGSSGVRVAGFASFNRVSSNWVGTDGVTAAGNRVGVEVEGSASNTAIGSYWQPDGSAPGGNVIGGNVEHGVNVRGTGIRNFVAGNLIGVLENGTDIGNGRHGVRTEAPGVLIGRGRGSFDQLFDDPNVVGFNGDSGMALFGDDVRVIENFVGVDAAGNSIGNDDFGVFVGGDGAVVEGNTIGDNGRDGVLLDGSSNDVEGNWIGVLTDGFSPAPNGESGVEVRGDSNTVGGSDPVDGNVIAFNGGSGVSFSGTAELGLVQNNEIWANGAAGIDVSGTATRNLFVENSITNNDGLGVDLGANGLVEPNDSEDKDDGPNDLMNTAVILDVDPGNDAVLFGFEGEPGGEFQVEFSANLACDQSDAGEGLRPLGTVLIETDGAGLFEDDVTVGSFVAGEVLTALVSAAPGGVATTTSEYSECFQVPGVNATDSDLDGIFDVFELDEDTDGDGLLNRFDADDDGDGRPTNVENVDIFNSGSGNTTSALNSDGLGEVDYLDPASLFRLLEPACRVLQTGTVNGGDSIDFSVHGGVPLSTFNAGPDSCVVPADATAVLANVIVVDPVAGGNLRITAAGTTPLGGVVNFSSNELNNSNAVSVPVSASGELNVSVNLGGSTAVAAGGIEVEILGFYQVAENPSLVLNTVTPCAVFDTRTTQGGSGPITADSLIGIDVVGSFPASQGGGNTNCQVIDGVEAVLVNVVAVNTSGIVDITGGAAGATVVSNQTHAPPMNNSSAVVLPVISNGEIVLDVDISGSSNVRVVVLGYYFPTMFGNQAAAGLEFTPVVPCAAFDTRLTQGSAGSFAGQRTNGQVSTYDVVGAFDPDQGGGNTDCGVPVSATAVELNLVAVGASQGGNLQVAAAGVAPLGGVLNFGSLTPAMNNSNALVVEVGSGGQIAVTVNAGGASGGVPITGIRGVVSGYYTFQADQS